MNLEESKKAFIQMLKIPSVTGTEGEERACAFLENILKEYGVSSRRIARVPERPNLLAGIRAEHPVKEPVILISHIDVVDGDAGQWTHPVFGGEEENGRIWGRGTLDTKQLTMMELYSFLGLKERQKELNRDVWFLAAVDEEKGSSYGMEYVKSVCPEIFRHAVVINEGGGFPLHINGHDYMTLTVGEKSVCRVRVWADGTAGHASAPGDDQAIQKLAAGLQRVFAAERELTCGSRQIWAAMRAITGSEEWDNPVALDIFHYAGYNSIAMRNYRIGRRSNIIPEKAETILEFKLLPGAVPSDVAEFLDRQFRGLSLSYKIEDFENGFEAELEDSFVKKMIKDLSEICEKHGFAGQVLPMLALGRTDGRFFGSDRSRVFGCSPLLAGDSFDVVLPKVHGNNESILEESYFFGCRVISDILQKHCLGSTDE